MLDCNDILEPRQLNSTTKNYEKNIGNYYINFVFA